MSKHSIIRVSITNDNITAKGLYYDSRGNYGSFNRQFSDENTMHNYMHEMKERHCEFQLVINRSMSKYTGE